MSAYTEYSEAVTAYNDIVSTGLKHGHLNGIYPLENPLPSNLTELKSWQEHIDKLYAKLEAISY